MYKRQQIIGGGADVFAGRRDALGQDVGQDALATDEGTDAAVVNDWFDDGALDNAGPRAIAALPAGDWVRVIKQVNGAASIEKMYIGITSSNGAAGAGAPEFSQNAAMEPPLPLNPDSAVLGLSLIHISLPNVDDGRATSSPSILSSC